MVAQYEVERAQQIVVALDAGRLMSAVGWAIGASWTMLVSAALAMAADRALWRPTASGVVAFAAEVVARVAPGSGVAAQRAADRPALPSWRAAFRGVRLRNGLSRDRADAAAPEPDRAVHRPVRSHRVERPCWAPRKLLTARHLVLIVADTTRRSVRALLKTPARTPATRTARAVAATVADERAAPFATLRDRGMLVATAGRRADRPPTRRVHSTSRTRGLLLALGPAPAPSR